MISIIILSYNTKDLLESCLSSIETQLREYKHEIIVVDNNSADTSVEMVEKQFPHVNLIKNKENVGFAKGVNIGAKQAKGDYVWFLNSDTQLLDASITTISDDFSQNKKLGVVGGLLVNKDNSLQRSYGKFYNVVYVLLMLTFGDKGEMLQLVHKPAQTDWVSGGCMFIRKSLFEELGGFDEYFFMYVEDMELCFRVKKKQYQVLVDPRLRVLHVGHGSSNRTFAIVHIYKGILYFFQKHHSRFSYIIVMALLRVKAYSAIGVGKLTKNAYLTKTYTQALQYMV